MAKVYDSLLWDQARERILARDGHACTVARLIGGECSPILDVHHLVPLSDGGDPFGDANLVTVCHAHHGRLEALRRHLLEPVWRCPHRHRTAEGRRQCEMRRMRVAA